MDFAIGGLAAMGATFFSNPLDVLKTRMQLQGELRRRGKYRIMYKNLAHAVYTIVQQEGVLALQKGLMTALLMHGVRNSIKLGTFQYLSNEGFVCDSERKTIFHRCLMASAFGGAMGAFAGNPLTLITTQLQSKAARNIAVGHQHNHPNIRSAFKIIYSKNGIRGLWRNGAANVTKTIVGSSAQLTSFTHSKELLRTFEIFQSSVLLTAFVASSVGGVLQSVLQTPFELVLTRLNNQFTDQRGQGILYKGMGDCFRRIWRTEGFLGLYKGFVPNYFRIARHTTISLMLWDILKHIQKKRKEQMCDFQVDVYDP